MPKKPNILVTGGTGFVGSNLVRELCKRGYNVTILAQTYSHKFLKGLPVKVITGDVRNYDDVFNAAKGMDYVYHLAASSSGDIREKENIFGINVKGTENVMKASFENKIKRVLHVSSGSALGFKRNPNEKLTEKDCLDFKDQIYGQSKKQGEDKVQEYVSKGLDAVIIIPSYVTGAGEVEPARFGIFKSILKDRVKFVYPGGGGGGAVAVEDLIGGMILAIEKGKKGERYILSNENFTLFDNYNLIAKLLNKPKIRHRIPSLFYYPMYLFALILQKTMKSPPITTETVRWAFNFRYYDSSKARKELGWKPKLTLEESYKKAIKYYREIGVLGQSCSNFKTEKYL